LSNLRRTVDLRMVLSTAGRTAGQDDLADWGPTRQGADVVQASVAAQPSGRVHPAFRAGAEQTAAAGFAGIILVPSEEASFFGALFSTGDAVVSSGGATDWEFGQAPTGARGATARDAWRSTRSRCVRRAHRADPPELGLQSVCHLLRGNALRTGT